jgi:hypothetical protein
MPIIPRVRRSLGAVNFPNPNALEGMIVGAATAATAVAAVFRSSCLREIVEFFL